jgi:hypothetical protein
MFHPFYRLRRPAFRRRKPALAIVSSLQISDNCSGSAVAARRLSKLQFAIRSVMLRFNEPYEFAGMDTAVELVSERIVGGQTEIPC